MIVVDLPPLPVESDVVDSKSDASGGEYVNRGEVERLVLGVMPTAMVHRSVPRELPVGIDEDFALAADLLPDPATQEVAPALAATPITPPAAKPSPAKPAADRADDLAWPYPDEFEGREEHLAMAAEAEQAPRHARNGRVVVRQGGGRRVRTPVKARRIEGKNELQRARRARPPQPAHPAGDPEDGFGRTRAPSISGLWVMLSSAFASAVLFMLGAILLNRPDGDTGVELSLPAAVEQPAEASASKPVLPAELENHRLDLMAGEPAER